MSEASVLLHLPGDEAFRQHLKDGTLYELCRATTFSCATHPKYGSKPMEMVLRPAPSVCRAQNEMPFQRETDF